MSSLEVQEERKGIWVSKQEAAARLKKSEKTVVAWAEKGHQGLEKKTNIDGRVEIFLPNEEESQSAAALNAKLTEDLLKSNEALRKMLEVQQELIETKQKLAEKTTQAENLSTEIGNYQNQLQRLKEDKRELEARKPWYSYLWSPLANKKPIH